MNVEEIKKELSKMTEEQLEIFKQIKEINKQKVELLNKELVVDENNFNRFEGLVNRYIGFVKGEKNISKINEDINRIYCKINEKIFSERLILDSKYTEKDGISYYRSIKGKKIAFSQGGLGYIRESYWNEKEIVRCFRNIQDVIKVMNNHKDLLRDIPLKSKKKLEMYQKFFDILINYKPIGYDDEKLTINFSIPITTLIRRESTKYNSLPSFIEYEDVREQEVNSMTVEYNYWNKYVYFYDNNGNRIFSLTVDFDSKDKFDNLKHFINQLPSEALDKFKLYIDDIENKLKTNEKIYEDLKSEFGYLFLSEVI